MPKAEKIIEGLNLEESSRWIAKVKSLRNRYIKSGKKYESEGAERVRIEERINKIGCNQAIKELREASYGQYLKDEAEFQNKVMHDLIHEAAYPSNMLSKLCAEKLPQAILSSSKPEELYQRIFSITGDFIADAMPYVYWLAKSTSQSRRSRSGTTFELLMERILTLKKVPWQKQKSLSHTLKRELGKKVDLVIPSGEKYTENRSQTMVITLKTSLRERWQEVIDEIARTRVPRIFLMTVDQDLNKQMAHTIDSHNIHLVVYDDVKSEKLDDCNNVISFTNFFEKEIPHFLSYWN